MNNERHHITWKKDEWTLSPRDIMSDYTGKRLKLDFTTMDKIVGCVDEVLTRMTTNRKPLLTMNWRYTDYENLYFKGQRSNNRNK